MRYAYYPGCSLKGSNKAYEESFLAVCKVLGVETREVEDWNCCGATAYMSVDENAALAMAARNLAIAERMGETEMMVPCSGCYLTLNKAKKRMDQCGTRRSGVAKALSRAGLEYKGKLKIRHPLDVLINDVGLEKIKKAVKKPLKGLKIAPYYGCQIVRPYAEFDDQHNPVSMDYLFKALGAKVIDYPMKTRCCGGSLTGMFDKVGQGLVHSLLAEAKKREADLIATICPLCHFNLDSYQSQIASTYGDVTIPCVYFTQLMGLAFGVPESKLGLKRNIVPAEGALAAISG